MLCQPGLKHFLVLSFFSRDRFSASVMTDIYQLFADYPLYRITIILSIKHRKLIHNNNQTSKIKQKITIFLLFLGQNASINSIL